MKTIFILLSGLLAGLAVNHLYFQHLTEKPALEFSANVAWIEKDLHLSATQSARIQALHQHYGPTFQLLFNKLAETRKAAEQLESHRQEHGAVDFMVFFQILEDQRRIEAEARNTTETFVAAVTSEMTPIQREQYLAFLSVGKQPRALSPEGLPQ